jgi:hypothetical protein
VIFKEATRAECVIYLPRHRLLVTCDSVQNYENDSLISPLGRLIMYPMGFFKQCVIGPIWLNARSSVSPASGLIGVSQALSRSLTETAERTLRAAVALDAGRRSCRAGHCPRSESAGVGARLGLRVGRFGLRGAPTPRTLSEEGIPPPAHRMQSPMSGTGLVDVGMGRRYNAVP